MGRILVAAVLPALLIPPSARAAEPAGGEAPSVAVGGDLRLRLEGLNNALDLDSAGNDSYGFFRLRSRLSVDARQGEGLRVYFRLANEYRWGRGELVSGLNDPAGKISLDNGYVDLRLKPVRGLGARIGRQDLMYGEGFLIFDGTPADGSASAYFDALRVTYAPCAARSVDLFMAKIEAEGFPATPALAGGSENIYGLYGTWAISPVRTADLYVLYHDKRDSTRAVGHPPQRTTAYGMRYAALPSAGLRLAAEGTVQAGRYAGRDRLGIGGYARAGWIGSASLHPGVEIAGLYLSGDDPGTSRYEGWDDFASEWPKYSELYIYTVYDALTRIRPDDRGAWTNLRSAWIEGRVAPVPRVTLLLRSAYFGAVEATGPGTGKVRGILHAGTLNVDLGKNLKGQALGEVFDPGSFYAREADTALYGRLQLIASF